MSTMTYTDLLEAVLAKLTELGHEKLTTNLSYATDKYELTSCLREYIFRTDAKTREFLDSVEMELARKLGTIVLKRNAVIDNIVQDFKQRLEAAIPSDSHLDVAGATKLQEMIATNYGGHPNATATHKWRLVVETAKQAAAPAET